MRLNLNPSKISHIFLKNNQKELMVSNYQIAIVGRPNVGTSTFFNRLLKQRKAIVGSEEGITRDRIYGEVEWWPSLNIH